MSLRSKLLVIVGAAGLGFILVIALTALIGIRETRELRAIEGRLLPRLALGPRLEADFERLARTMRDAVAAQDLPGLDEARSVRARMLERLAAVPGAVTPAEAALIRQRVDDYYDAAQNVSRRLIAQETGEEMTVAIATMQAKQAAAADMITQTTSLDYRQLTDHFAAIHAARAAAARLRLALSCACLALVLFLTIKFSREVLAVVVNLSLGFRRFGQGDFSQPIPITTKDEIGHLSAEANQMAERLRTTLDRLATTSANLARTNEELQAFSYSVAHDLRAPLRAINGFAQMVLESYNDKLDAEGRDWLREIVRNTTKMADLIDALLSLARLTRAELRVERVDISGLARAAGAQLAAAEPDRTVALVVQDGLEARADPSLLRAVIDNLVGNAWKFSSKAAAPRIEVGATEANGGRAFFVRDNGAGFDMEFAKKLFVPFQRLHRATEYPGTGIGLATVQRIVNRHGGRVWAEGRVNDGATFYFTLPETAASE